MLRGHEHTEHCDAALIQFERMLRQRDDKYVRYEWANVSRTGLLVEFEILWYDLWFFDQRREAYRVGPHPFAFHRFGATADDFVVTHELVR